MSLESLEIIEDANGVFSFKTTSVSDLSRIDITAENYKYKHIDCESIDLYFEVTRPEAYYGVSLWKMWRTRIVWALKCLLGMGITLSCGFTFRDKKHFDDFVEGLQKMQQLKTYNVGG